MSFKTVRDICQKVWFYVHSHVTHLLCHEVIRNVPQHVWIFPRFSITHFLRLKIIRDICQWAWSYAHCLLAYLLCLMMVGDFYYPSWNICKQGHIYLDPLDWKRSIMYPEAGIFVSDNFKTTICYFHNFSVSFFSSYDIHQSITWSGRQAMGKSPFFIFYFIVSLPFLITIASFNKFIIIAILIVIMPYF